MKCVNISTSVWEAVEEICFWQAHSWQSHVHNSATSLSLGPRGDQLACVSTSNTLLRPWVHAQSNKEEGLPVSLLQACNRTRSVIRWPTLRLLVLCPYCPSPLHLAHRSYLIIAPSVLDSALLGTHPIKHFPFLLLRRQSSADPPTIVCHTSP